MEANELRIGNWVQWNNMQFKIAGILQYDAVDLEYNEDFPKWHPEDLSINKILPIPLTEEWLLKFGFRKSQYDEAYYSPIKEEDFTVVYINGEFWFCTYDDNFAAEEKSYSERVELNSVHQTQNLFFAWSGEELEIKSLVE